MGSDVHIHFDSKSGSSDVKRFNCPNCGASIVEGSRFCVFCGTTIKEDTTHRAEVRIEDVAEVRRADYETRESRIREQEMTHDLRWKLLKRYLSIAWCVITALLFLVGFILDKTGNDYNAIGFRIIALGMLAPIILVFLSRISK